VITEVPGVRVGHWTGGDTGVTVVLFPPETVASAEVRGGAPATRETALLDPTSTVQHVDAIVFSGGSAFGLATADGLMAELAEQGRGFPTRAGPVPIVPAAALFDLADEASRTAAPGPEEGRAALRAALAGNEGDPTAFERGAVGAGRGARFAKWRGAEHALPGGLGTASVHDGDVVVGALAVVNAVGDIVGDDGSTLAGSSAPKDALPFPESKPFEEAAPTNTTLVVIATNARCTKLECYLLAQSGHHGLAQAIHPSHTRYDGDVVFAAATGAVDAHFDRLRVLATEITAAAIRDAVTYAA
jgi:L-aminopeptidase/D-esterase-like protein